MAGTPVCSMVTTKAADLDHDIDVGICVGKCV